MSGDSEPPLYIDRPRSAVCAVQTCARILVQHDLPAMLAEVQRRREHRNPKQLSFWDVPTERDRLHAEENEEALLRAALPLWEESVSLKE